MGRRGRATVGPAEKVPDPVPGTRAFGQRAAERRARLRGDVGVTDIVSGKKTGLRERKRRINAAETY